MKIVALHTDFRIYWPARLKEVNNALVAAGHSFEVIEIAGAGSNYAFDNGSASGCGLRWHILFPESSPTDLSPSLIWRKLCQILDELNPDVILAGSIAFPSGALAVRWCVKRNRRVIIFDDSKIDNVKRNGVVNFIKQSVYNGADAFLLPAEQWLETSEYWGFKPEETFYGVDVVDNDFWGRKREAKPQISDYFLAVGRQIPIKNFISIIPAYKRYVDCVGSDKAIPLLMVGDGPQHTEMKNMAKESGLSELITFWPFQDQDSLAILFQNARAMILNSFAETWGLVINEALACGCPVVASNTCGAAEPLIINGDNGWIVDCDDSESLTNAMIAMHSLNDTELDAMKAKAKKSIERFSLGFFADNVAKAVEFVSSKPKRSTSLIDKLIINLWGGRYRPI